MIFDNSVGALGNWQDQNLWNKLVSSGIAITSSSVKIILRSITITSSAISIAALETGSGWPAGTNLEVVIESTSQIVGRRGTGGEGAWASSSGVASAGGAGGRALTITSAISGGSIKIINQGAIRGGGGGGGRGRAGGTSGYFLEGGTGGTGYGSTGTAGAVAAATAGTKPNAFGGQGGTGGAEGIVGNAGAAGTGFSSNAGAAGGAAGPAIINSALATIVNTGTISGSLS